MCVSFFVFFFLISIHPIIHVRVFLCERVAVLVCIRMYVFFDWIAFAKVGYTVLGDQAFVILCQIK